MAKEIAKMPEVSNQGFIIAKMCPDEMRAKLIKDDTKMVKGRFRFFENPGASQVVTIKKYKEVPTFSRTMIDGHAYEIPLYVARFLNGIDICASAINGQVGTCSYGVHGFKWDNNAEAPQSVLGNGPDGQGNVPVPVVSITSRVRRFGFESMEFDFMSSSI